MSTLLEARAISKRFGGNVAVSNVFLQVPSEGILALVGPNGAGKTTLFNILGGQVAPDSGSVWLDGRRIDGYRPSTIASLGVVRSWQDTRVLPELSALDNVILGTRLRHAEHPLLAILRRSSAKQEEVRAEAAAMTALEAVGYTGNVRELASELSVGELKLVALARLLLTQPKLLLLDEPTSGLDGHAVGRTLRTVTSIANNGTPIVIVEHNLTVVRQVAAHAVFMSNGVIVAQGTPASLMQRPDLVDLYFGRRLATSMR